MRHETYGILDNPVGEVPDPHIILVEEHLECLQAAFADIVYYGSAYHETDSSKKREGKIPRIPPSQISDDLKRTLQVRIDSLPVGNRRDDAQIDDLIPHLAKMLV